MRTLLLILTDQKLDDEKRLNLIKFVIRVLLFARKIEDNDKILIILDNVLSQIPEKFVDEIVDYIKLNLGALRETIFKDLTFYRRIIQNTNSSTELFYIVGNILGRISDLNDKEKVFEILKSGDLPEGFGLSVGSEMTEKPYREKLDITVTDLEHHKDGIKDIYQLRIKAMRERNLAKLKEFYKKGLGWISRNYTRVLRVYERARSLGCDLTSPEMIDMRIILTMVRKNRTVDLLSRPERKRYIVRLEESQGHIDGTVIGNKAAGIADFMKIKDEEVQKILRHGFGATPQGIVLNTMFIFTIIRENRKIHDRIRKIIGDQKKDKKQRFEELSELLKSEARIPGFLGNWLLQEYH
ncbi:MAG: hypothetical protein KAV18_03820, partial [Candidatus Omnitrophica bacterium]|nr:hypothetical protein [Candidatus Omnitrophota bacterium]